MTAVRIGSELRVGPVESAGRAEAAELAALTRDAYAGSDPLPGLPVPDGARETAESMLGFLARGGVLWVARDGRGVAVAVLRTTVLSTAAPVPSGGGGAPNGTFVSQEVTKVPLVASAEGAGGSGGAWFVSRVAVAPGLRGAGVGARLLVAVEARAAAAGVRAVCLDAVIERCVPPYYARLGYRVTEHHLPDDDKPLTEVLMARDPAMPRRPAEPYPRTGAVVCWFVTDRGLVAGTDRGQGGLVAAVRRCADRLADPTARVAGVDSWRGPVAALDRVLGGPVVRYAGGRADVPAHLMPRTHHRDLWAALRFAPGREPRPTFLDPEARTR